MINEHLDQNQVEEQHKIIGNILVENKEFKRTTHADAQWFPEAGLGLFIHWGINSVWGMGDISWPMMKSLPGNLSKRHKQVGIGAHWVNIKPVDYWALAEQFNPQQFDPDKILRAAKEAGCRYAVFTTKHHDGFAMWPSKYGDFNTNKFLDGRDLVREYVDACRRQNLKVGLYYSPPDWYFNRDFMSFSKHESLDKNYQTVDLDSISSEAKEEQQGKFHQFLRGQVTELLTRYGQIDLMWFDGKGHDFMSAEEIREMQPGIVINPRAWGYGDFLTPEGKLPETRIDGWWEFCTCFCNGGWGYIDNEIHQPAGWFLEMLAKTRSWDGNFLPSTGPDGNGEMPAIYYKRMKQISDWMIHSGKSIFGVRGVAYPEQSNVPVTKRGNTWYVHVHWLHDVPVEIKTQDMPVRARLLRTGDDITLVKDDGKISFTIPVELRTNLTDVVEIEWPKI
ncbi:MAG: alpha-L-fucosidase [Lentisphaerae bacterium]|nr:alpha-L-fucosidase [Lentisphaerota bacterium]